MARARGEYGCRDCVRCNTSAAASASYKAGRAGLAMMTLGGSSIARGLKKKCGVCGHLLGEHDAEAVAAAAQPVQSAPPSPLAPFTAPTPPPPAPDRIAQLRELGELRDAGVLSEEEFLAEKAAILGGEGEKPPGPSV